MFRNGALARGVSVLILMWLIVWMMCQTLTACGAVARGTASPPVAALRVAAGTILASAAGSLVFVWVCFRSIRVRQKNSKTVSIIAQVGGARRDSDTTESNDAPTL